MVELLTIHDSDVSLKKVEFVVLVLKIKLGFVEGDTDGRCVARYLGI